jgi:hypothetical protein
MKILSLVSATAFCAALLSLPARADEPQAIKLTPQIRAMLSELLKTADAEPAETATPTDPAPTPSTPPAIATAPGSKANQPATGLSTSSLRTSGLMTSASLGGHGLIGGTPRLTDAEWRQQFPVRK